MLRLDASVVVLLLLLACTAALAARPPTGLYGLAPNVQLISVDTDTGKSTPIGSPLPYELQGQQLSTIDTENAILYAVFYNDSAKSNALVGLSIEDGSIVSETPLPFVTGAFVGVGEVCDFDPLLGEVIAMGREDISPSAVHHLVRINPHTGNVTELAQIGDIDVLGGASGFDPSTGLEWLQLSIENATGAFILQLAYDARSGRQVHQLDNPLNIETYAFDPQTNRMIGVGLTPTGSRIVVALDSTSGNQTTLGPVPGYFILDGGISALDPSGRHLYAILSPAEHEQDFRLVSINPDKGGVDHAVELGAAATSPWSLEWLP